MWFRFVVELIDLDSPESSSSGSQADLSMRAKESDLSQIPGARGSFENVQLKRGDEGSQSPSTSTNISASDIPPKSETPISSKERVSEDDCFFAQDLSLFKRVRVISRQDRVQKSISRSNIYFKTMANQFKRPRWNISLYLVMESIAYDHLWKCESHFGLYHEKTVGAMILLANTLRVWRNLTHHRSYLK
jgi:hypothetical protein